MDTRDRQNFRILSTSVLTFAVMWLLSLAPQTFAANEITADEAYEIGSEAYVFLYPLVMMDVTRLQFTNVENDKETGKAPLNTFVHARLFPPATFKGIVRPNFDTLYSSAWADLSQEPLILSIPDTENRYYVLQILNLWTDPIATPSQKTTGNKATNYALLPPNWKGDLPEGIEPIQSTTAYAWLVLRTQTDGSKDFKTINKIQDDFKLTPLSKWGQPAEPEKVEKPAKPERGNKSSKTAKADSATKAEAPAKPVVDPKIDMKTPPLKTVNGLSTARFFSYAAELLAGNPAYASDWSTVTRLKRIGLEAGKPFDLAALSPAVRSALDRAVSDSQSAMKSKSSSLTKLVNGWGVGVDSIGDFGDVYLKRAITAMIGLGLSAPEDAIYPQTSKDSEGNTLVGGNKYVLHFEKGKLPPTGAFWSLTLYNDDGFPTKNSMERYSLDSRDTLKLNDDGSLDLFIQSKSPGGDKESNWLPAPKNGSLSLTLRIYSPKADALTGKWAPPAVQQVLDPK